MDGERPSPNHHATLAVGVVLALSSLLGAGWSILRRSKVVQPSRDAHRRADPLALASLILSGLSLATIFSYLISQRSRMPGENEEKIGLPDSSLKEGHPDQRSTRLSAPARPAGSDLQVETHWVKRGKSKPRLGLVRSISLIAGVLLAYTGQALLDAGKAAGFLQHIRWVMGLPETSHLWAGVLLYLVAAALWLLALPASRKAVPEPKIEARLQPLKEWPVFGAGWPRFTLLAVSALAFFLDLILFAARGETAPLRWMWGASIGSFVLAWLPFPGRSQPVHPRAEFSPRFHWTHGLGLGLILAAGFFLRYYHLETLPYDLHGDMASYGLQARDILFGIQRNVFSVGWAGIPITGYFPAVISMAVFGNDLFGLNMSAFAGGMLTLVAVYLLAWRLSDSHRLALLTTALVAGNVAHIHFSRLAAYMDPWPFSLFSLFFFVDGLRGRKASSFAFAGILIGFALLMYYSGRVAPLILIGMFLYVLFLRRSWLRDTWLGLAVFAAGVLLVFGPYLVYFAQNWQALVERSQAVWLFNPDVMHHLMGKYHLESALGVFGEQARRTLLTFHYFGDSSTQFGYSRPMFSSWVSPWIVLGLVLAIKDWKKPVHALVLIWLALMMLFGSILTVDAPAWPRLVGIIPAGALLAALALENILRQVAHSYGKPGRWLGSLLVAILVVAAGWQTWNQYLKAAASYAHAEALIGRYIYTLPAEVAACGFSDPYKLEVREIHFLAWPRQTVDFSVDAPDSALAACPGPPFVWILSPGAQGRQAVLQARWPEGTLEVHSLKPGEPIFTSYLVSGPVRLDQAVSPATEPPRP